MGQAEISPKSGEHPVDNLAKARWQSRFYIWRKGGHPSREERGQDGFHGDPRIIGLIDHAVVSLDGRPISWATPQKARPGMAPSSRALSTSRSLSR